MRVHFTSKCLSLDRVISSGLRGFDLATGCGGIPRGELLEIYGAADTGKSALGLHFIARVQAAGGVAALLDTEGKFDPTFAGNIGVITCKLQVSQLTSAEKLFAMCEILALGGAIDLVVIDTMTALIPESELEGGAVVTEDGVLDNAASAEMEGGDENVDLVSAAELGNAGDELGTKCDFARDKVSSEFVSRGLRRLARVAKQTGVTFVLINQARANLNVNLATELVSTGGMPVCLRSVLRIQLCKNSEIYSEGKVVGVNLIARFIKNMYSLRCLNVWLVLYHQTGFSALEGLVLNALELGILRKRNDGLYIADQRLGTDRESVCCFLAANNDITSSIGSRMDYCYRLNKGMA